MSYSYFDRGRDQETTEDQIRDDIDNDRIWKLRLEEARRLYRHVDKYIILPEMTDEEMVAWAEFDPDINGGGDEPF